MRGRIDGNARVSTVFPTPCGPHLRRLGDGGRTVGSCDSESHTRSFWQVLGNLDVKNMPNSRWTGGHEMDESETEMTLTQGKSWCGISARVGQFSDTTLPNRVSGLGASVGAPDHT